MASFSPRAYLNSDVEKLASAASGNKDMVDLAKQRASTYLLNNNLTNNLRELSGDISGLQDFYQKGQESVGLSGGINQLVNAGVGLFGGMKFGGNEGLGFMADNTNDFSSTDAIAMGAPVEKANWLSEPENFVEWSTDMPVDANTFGSYDF
tara:strand:+ start:425 stop:877 length:453 start_codon:yes stop_codon:yes gene_type:complete